MKKMDEISKTQLEAATFRRLVDHLKKNTDLLRTKNASYSKDRIY